MKNSITFWLGCALTFAVCVFSFEYEKSKTPTTTIACHTSAGKAQCIRDADVYVCSDTKRKKLLNNNIYSNCRLHEVK